jgi:hypothetical protein
MEKFEIRMTKFETNPNVEARTLTIKHCAMLGVLSLTPRFSEVGRDLRRIEPFHRFSHHSIRRWLE